MKAPIRPESLLEFKIAETQVRDKVREWYGNRWFAPNALKSPRAHRPRPRPLHSILDLRRAGSRRLDRRSRPLLLRHRALHRLAGPQRRRGRCSKTRWVPAAGELDHFFDDELVARLEGRHARAAAQDRALPDHHRPQALRARLPQRLGRRAIPDRPRRRRAARARHHAAKDRVAVRQRSPRRHAPQSRGRCRFFRGRPSSTSSCPSGCSATPTARRSIKSSSTATPAPSPANIR